MCNLPRAGIFFYNLAPTKTELCWRTSN